MATTTILTCGSVAMQSPSVARDANANGAPPVSISWEKRPHPSSNPPKTGGVYLHYKGAQYVVLGFARRRLSVPENGRETPIGVLYCAATAAGVPSGDLFFRDLTDWNVMIGETPRFKPLPDGGLPCMPGARE